MWQDPILVGTCVYNQGSDIGHIIVRVSNGLVIISFCFWCDEVRSG